MTKYFCDKCKQETGKGLLYEVSINTHGLDMSVGSASTKKYEICSQCEMEFSLFLTNHLKTSLKP